MTMLQVLVRQLVFARSFSLGVIGTIALGVGVSTGVFGVVNAVLIKQVASPHAGSLLSVGVSNPDQPVDYFSYPDFLAFSSNPSRPRVGAAVSNVVAMPWSVGTLQPHDIKVQFVSEGFLAALGTPPIIGRDLSRTDDIVGSVPVALASYSFWKSELNGAALDNLSQIKIHGVPITVVGVTPRSFEGVEPGSSTSLWLPLVMQKAVGYTGSAQLDGVDNTRPWMTQENAQWLHGFYYAPGDPRGQILRNDLERYVQSDIAASLQKISDPEERALLRQVHATVSSFGTGLSELRTKVRLPLKVAFVISIVFLLIASTNVVTLTLLRMLRRLPEIRMRILLGARRSDLVMLILSEAWVMAAIGTCLSVPIIFVVRRILINWLLPGQAKDITFSYSDWRVFIFLATSVITVTLASAILPSLRACKEIGVPSSSRTVHGGRRHSMVQQAIMCAQIAVSVIMIAFLYQTASSLQQFLHRNLGLDNHSLLTVDVQVDGAERLSAQQLVIMYRRMVDGVRKIPYVESASVSGCGLLNGCVGMAPMSIPGITSKVDDGSSFVQRNYVGPNYFSTVGMHIVSGRGILTEDSVDSPLIAVVNAAFDRHFMRGSRHLGESVLIENKSYRIVGIVEDARVNNVHDEAVPMLYGAIDQAPGWTISQIVIRAHGNPENLKSSVIARLNAIDPHLRIGEAATVDHVILLNLSQEVLINRAANLLGILGICLCAFAVYLVLSFRMQLRLKEIGIRIALGASRQSVYMLAFREIAPSLLYGIMFGVGVATLVGKVGTQQLRWTGAGNMVPYLIAVGVTTLAVLVASLPPVIQASQIDPSVTLRSTE